MAQEKKVKWALGTDEPDDLAEFLDNEEIVKRHGLPPKGTYTFAVKRLAVKPNRNGDDRISAMLIMKEPKKSDAAKWNGYLVWDGFNVTEQGAPFIKRFLKGLGLSWKDFIGATKRDNQEPPHITAIGRVKFEKGTDPTVRALVKVMPSDDWNDDEHLEVTRYLPADEDEGKTIDELTAEEEVTTVLDEPTEGEDDSETLTIEKLEAMDMDDLRDVAKQAGIKKKDMAEKPKALRKQIAKVTNLPPF